MIYGSNTSFNEGSSLELISASALPEAELRTICIVTSENVGDILLQTKAPEHALGRCWIQMEQYGERHTISNGGGLMFKLGQAWRSDGENWLPVCAYYSLWNEWVQFSWEFVELGFEWNYGQTSPLLTRTGAAVGLEASAGVGVLAGSSGFDNMPIYKDIVRVNLADDGTINAIEGDEGFKTDGSNGQVMTRIPAFYYKVTQNADTTTLSVSICNNKHLTPLDRFITEQIKPAHYVRYADDFVLLDSNKRKLVKAEKQIREFSKKMLFLDLHENACVFKVRRNGENPKSNNRSVDFVGMRFCIGYTVLRKQNALAIMRQSRKIRRAITLGKPISYRAASGFISRAAQLKFCKSYGLRRKYVDPKEINILKGVVRNESKRQQRACAAVFGAEASPAAGQGHRNPV